MPLAERLQWLYVAPLQIAQKLVTGISATRSITEAVDTAIAISNAGQLSVYLAEQKIGFVRFTLVKKGWERNRTWVIEVNHVDHFKGRYSRVPDLVNTKWMRFSFLGSCIPGASPSNPASYLKIEQPIYPRDETPS